MNKILLFAVFGFIFISCKKDYVTEKPVTTSHLTSLTIYNTLDHIVEIDSFLYDANGQIAKYRNWSWDSTQTPMITDSAYYNFSFSGTNVFPTSYTLAFIQKGSTLSSMETHNLYYDNQNKVIKDSFMDGGVNYRGVLYFHYNTSNITYDFFTSTINSNAVEKIRTDSLFITSGNVTNLHSYYYSPAIIYNYLQEVRFSTYPNPLYNKDLASGIGAFFRAAIDADFISPYMTNYVSNTYPPQADVFTSNFNWVTDTQGRIIKGEEVGAGIYYTMRYN